MHHTLRSAKLVRPAWPPIQSSIPDWGLANHHVEQNGYCHTESRPVSLAALPEVFQQEDPVSRLGLMLQAAGSLGMLESL